MSKITKINSEHPVAQNHQHQFFQLSDVQGKGVEISYSGKDIFSDAGLLLLLRALEKQTEIISGMSKCITDDRDQRYIDHGLEQLLSQRIYKTAAGFEDAKDCDELRGNSIFKICSGKLPQSGGAPASQLTMSRFENSVSRSELYRIAKHITSCFINSP